MRIVPAKEDAAKRAALFIASMAVLDERDNRPPWWPVNTIGLEFLSEDVTERVDGHMF